MSNYDPNCPRCQGDGDYQVMYTDGTGSREIGRCNCDRKQQPMPDIDSESNSVSCWKTSIDIANKSLGGLLQDHHANPNSANFPFPTHLSDFEAVISAATEMLVHIDAQARRIAELEQRPTFADAVAAVEHMPVNDRPWPKMVFEQDCQMRFRDEILTRLRAMQEQQKGNDDE